MVWAINLLLAGRQGKDLKRQLLHQRIESFRVLAVKKLVGKEHASTFSSRAFEGVRLTGKG